MQTTCLFGVLLWW